MPNPRLTQIIAELPFEKKIAGLTKTLAEQIQEEKKLDDEIKKQLKNVGFKLE